MAYGTIVASLTVEEFGAEKFKQTTQEDINKRYQQLKELTHF
jgi:hypothetical protein